MIFFDGFRLYKRTQNVSHKSKSITVPNLKFFLQFESMEKFLDNKMFIVYLPRSFLLVSVADFIIVYAARLLSYAMFTSIYFYCRYLIGSY